MCKTMRNRTAKEFYNEIFMPSYQTWCSSKNRRHQEWLIRAVVGFLNDLIEYDAADKMIDARKLRKNLRIVHPLGLITDIADGTKHVELKRSLKDITESSAATLSSNVDDWGSWDDIPDIDNHAVFLVETDDGKEFDVDDLIKDALVYWQGRFAPLEPSQSN